MGLLSRKLLPIIERAAMLSQQGYNDEPTYKNKRIVKAVLELLDILREKD